MEDFAIQRDCICEVMHFFFKFMPIGECAGGGRGGKDLELKKLELYFSFCHRTE